jgi:hypothetical protein
MPCQHIAEVYNFEKRVRLTRQRMVATKRHIHRIESAKTLVCGTPSPEAIAKLRHDFESLLPMLEEGYRALNSGVLDSLSDEELCEFVKGMQERDAKMSLIYDGSLRIGLEGIEPFPQLLAQFKMYQEKFQSQLEGILLSLNDSFQDLLKKSAQELNVPA